MKKTGIYRIYNKRNDKSYVGQALDIKNRWNGHLRELKEGIHHNILLQRDWDIYGEDNFEFSIISECKPIELNAMEKLYMDIYNCTNTGYNVADGNKAISKRYKDELLNNKTLNKKKDTNAITSNLENIKKSYKAANKKEETLYRQECIKLVKEDIKKRSDVKILDDNRFTVNANFFEFYLKIRKASDCLPSFGDAGSKCHITLSLYSDFWEAIGEVVNEKYSYLSDMNKDYIRIAPPSIRSHDGIIYDGNYKYLSYEKIDDKYYFTKTTKKDIASDYHINKQERNKIHDETVLLQYSPRLSLTNISCIALKGLFQSRAYIKNECPEYYCFLLELVERSIKEILSKTNKYRFKGQLLGIVESRYIISKTHLEDEYFILDLSYKKDRKGTYEFLLENWEELADIKFKQNGTMYFIDSL